MCFIHISYYFYCSCLHRRLVLSNHIFLGVLPFIISLNFQITKVDKDKPLFVIRGIPGSSADKESACNTGDPGSISGLWSSPGEGIGYPLQYSWASLEAQTVKNPPAMPETWVQSLGLIPELGISTGEGNGYPLQYSGLENSMGCIHHGVTKSRTWLSDFHSLG